MSLSSLPSSPPPPLLQILISLQLAENNKTNKKLSTFGITPGMITPLSYDHMPFKLVFEDILLPPLSIYLSFHLSSPPPSLPLPPALPPSLFPIFFDISEVSNQQQEERNLQYCRQRANSQSSMMINNKM